MTEMQIFVLAMIAVLAAFTSGFFVFNMLIFREEGRQRAERNREEKLREFFGR